MLWSWVWKPCTLLHLAQTVCKNSRRFSATQSWHFSTEDAWVLLLIHWQNWRFSFSITWPEAFSLQSNLLSPGQEDSLTSPLPWQIPNSFSCHNQVHGGEGTHKYLGVTTVLNIWISLGLMRRNTSHQHGFWWKSISEALPSNFRSCFPCETSCLATCLCEITALSNQHTENKPQIKIQKKQNYYWNVLNACLMSWKTMMWLLTDKLWM